MSRRRPRKKLEGTDLELTAFINPMVVLVTFLLINVVFTHTAVLGLKLPGPASPSNGAPPEQQKSLVLEVTVRAQQIELADRNRGPLATIPNTAQGPDFAALSAKLRSLKDQYPDQKDATVLVEADIDYNRIIQVMDAVRSSQRELAGHRIVTELFPQVALGDAPLGVSAQGISPQRTSAQGASK